MMSKLRKITSNESGMAIIMVTTAVAILTFILVEFTFETKLNKIRVENQVDRYQARLNAEAGIKFALAKLKIYRVAWNTLEDNESMKKTVSPSMAEKVVTQPFFYPIPLDKRANIIQKNAVAEFEKNNLINGEMNVEIQPITGFLNPNTLKVIKEANSNQNQGQDNNDRDDNNETSNLKPFQFMEKTFFETLEKLVKDKNETDEEFALKYSNLNVELLIKELKYYVNNPKDYDEPEKADIEKNYELAGIKAKHAPLETLDEMYMLQGWDDEIVNLLKDKMSVHQVSVININEITENQLRVLFPAITNFQVETFFKRKNGDDEQGQKAKDFQDEPEFKKYITEELGVLDASSYDKRIAEFKKARITLGVAAKLFKVISKGAIGRTSYTLEAFIDLPVKPEPPKETKPKSNTSRNGQENNSDLNGEDGDNGNSQSNSNENDGKETKPAKIYLLEPRIVEIRQI
ncbi:hypothetical protein M900_1663 [Bacteriovorax sp. Seq25_V]|nr:hypothetical protein M900_1663 [Bacteriovorax sp. Seq25_V]